ncbi:MAG TPA: hypothetical protein VKR59_08305 [Terriglobales bacterium]|nr:hypothetical protein [Terriglobales bacterium]
MNSKTRKWVVSAAALACAFTSMGLVSANEFPDRTFAVLQAFDKKYSDIVSRITPMPTGRDRSLAEAQIAEAAFRDLITWHSHHRRPIFFLETNGQDPSDDLIIRLSESGSRVSKASAVYFDKRILSGPLDRGTGERGILLSVGPIKWLFGDRVQVHAAMNCGPLCGKGGVYELVKNKGRWNVEAYTNQFFY